jgi:hypothetical protein
MKVLIRWTFSRLNRLLAPGLLPVMFENHLFVPVFARNGASSELKQWQQTVACSFLPNCCGIVLLCQRARTQLHLCTAHKMSPDSYTSRLLHVMLSTKLFTKPNRNRIDHTPFLLFVKCFTLLLININFFHIFIIVFDELVQEDSSFLGQLSILDGSSVLGKWPI